MMRFLQLGASLYVPGTHGNLAAIGNLQRFPKLRSVIFCTEDAIRAEEVSPALANLAAALPRFEPVDLLRFIRVRSPIVLRSLLGMSAIEQVHGFVIPKVTPANLDDCFDAFAPEDPFEVMLTLETLEAFDARQMLALRDRLLYEPYRRRILSLRIGGNDLFHLLSLRRPSAHTVYDTPLGVTISQLVTTFRPHGFNLTGPVFEFLDRNDVLARETRRDLLHGLFGKTAIHPDQVSIIEAQYRVSRSDLHMAERILEGRAPAVFRSHNAMCEPATHRGWAALILERARLYGVTASSRPRELRIRMHREEAAEGS